MRFLYIFCFALISQNVIAQTIYDVQVQSIDGKIINMASFKGKKILIASGSPDILQKETIPFLDSLQKVNASLVIIAVPASDFGGTQNSAILTSIENSVKTSLLITTLSELKKEGGVSQNALMQWLTNRSRNSHFDAEVNTDSQLYVISESGILYCVLEKGAPLSVLRDVLKNPVDE